MIAPATLPIGAGSTHACAGVAGLSCWENGDDGQLGDGTNNARPLPVAVAGGSWKSVDGSGFMTCGIDGGNNWKCWGRNDAGLGIADTTQSNTPLTVGEAGAWAQVGVGGSGRSTGAACALRTDDGSLWCFGFDQLAGGAYTETPVKVSGSHVFTDFAVGFDHACAIDDAGAAWCWGNNGNGTFGDGATADSDTPVSAGAMAIADDGMQFVDIAAGEGFTCAVRNDWTLWCWGSALTGRLGNGASAGSELNPVQVGAGVSWRRAFAGSTHACGIDASGAAHCWGDNRSRQTGSDLSAMTVLTPAITNTALRFVALALTNSSTCGITTEDELACWGSSARGLLADGLSFTLDIAHVAP